MNTVIYAIAALMLLIIVGAFVTQRFFPEARLGSVKLSYILWAAAAFIGTVLIIIIRAVTKSDALKEAELKLKMKSAEASLEASRHAQEQNLKKIQSIDAEVGRINTGLSTNAGNVNALMDKRKELESSHEDLKKEIDAKRTHKSSIEDALSNIRSKVGD